MLKLLSQQKNAGKLHWEVPETYEVYHPDELHGIHEFGGFIFNLLIGKKTLILGSTDKAFKILQSVFHILPRDLVSSIQFSSNSLEKIDLTPVHLDPDYVDSELIDEYLIAQYDILDLTSMDA